MAVIAGDRPLETAHPAAQTVVSCWRWWVFTRSLTLDREHANSGVGREARTPSVDDLGVSVSDEKTRANARTENGTVKTNMNNQKNPETEVLAGLPLLLSSSSSPSLSEHREQEQDPPFSASSTPVVFLRSLALLLFSALSPYSPYPLPFCHLFQDRQV